MSQSFSDLIVLLTSDKFKQFLAQTLLNSLALAKNHKSRDVSFLAIRFVKTMIVTIYQMNLAKFGQSKKVIGMKSLSTNILLDFLPGIVGSLGSISLSTDGKKGSYTMTEALRTLGVLVFAVLKDPQEIIEQRKDKANANNVPNTKSGVDLSSSEDLLEKMRKQFQGFGVKTQTKPTNESQKIDMMIVTNLSPLLSTLLRNCSHSSMTRLRLGSVQLASTILEFCGKFLEQNEVSVFFFWFFKFCLCGGDDRIPLWVRCDTVYP
eukprot:TRINITY_DN6089_c0_g2_i2.p1 TRINITY_DN6089_c0_g2~~TRINITY_DN6089_c0_g2_i2.p1  ORF type:complete len:306 (-),score=65.26 TRINITY_DN6089_c0_g2_i2:34-825(-)